MANQPKGKAKTQVNVAKKPAKRSGNTSASRAKAKPVDLSQPTGSFLVTGRVMTTDGLLAGARVRVVDQDRRGENPLGEARTDGQGHYEIRYTSQQFRRTKKKIGGPDLIVRVYSAEGKVMAQSKRKRNAGREETVNLTVGSEVSFTVSGTVRRELGDHYRIAATVSTGK